MDGPVGIANPTSTWTLETAYQYATARAIPPTDPDGEPLYNCPFPPCSKQFSKRFNLKAHLRVHTGDKPFACSYPGCSRRFMWKSSLTSHQAGHSRRKAELAKRNNSLPVQPQQQQPPHRRPQWNSTTHQPPPSSHPQQTQQHYFQQQQQQQQQHPHHNQIPFSQPVSTSQMSFITNQQSLISQPLPTTSQSTYTSLQDRHPLIDQTQQQTPHHFSPTAAEVRHRQREQDLQQQERELHRQQQRLKQQEQILKQHQLHHQQEQRRIEHMKAHREQPIPDNAHQPQKSLQTQQSQPLPTSSLALTQHQLPTNQLRAPAPHPQRPPVPPPNGHHVHPLPSVSPRPLPHHTSHQPHHQYEDQSLPKSQPLVDAKMEPSPIPKQEDIPQHTSSRPPTSPVPPTSGRDLARLMKKDALAQSAKPSPSILTHPSSHDLSSTPSLLPSPSASLGMPPSPTAFTQQFLFPSQASSPTWASTPNVPTPSGPVRSPMAVSPKPPNTPSNQMDLQMNSGEHHAGDLSPLPAELPASPSVASPVPPPILPEVSNNRTRRIPNRSARPPLGPSLSSGPSTLLPPLGNVVPAHPPTHIDLGGLVMEDEPSSSLPALGSPHTELSPLPVASPIFGTSQAPTSPMQPFSPFSGMNASSARTKPTTTW